MATPPVFVSGAVLLADQMNDIGFWLVKQQSFSAVSTISADGVFTSDFTCYRLLIRSTNTGASPLYRLRASGVAESGSVYVGQRFRSTATTDGGTSATATSGGISNDPVNLLVNVWAQHDFYGPQLTENTFVMGNFTSDLPSAGFIGSRVNTATAYDGIEFNVASGTTTGEFSIYGYNK